MSIFTGSELEFLAGLNKSWWRLYWKEFSRLRRIEAAASRGAAGMPALSAETGACGEDPACVFLRPGATDPANSNLMRRRVELAAGNR